MRTALRRFGRKVQRRLGLARDTQARPWNLHGSAISESITVVRETPRLTLHSRQREIEEYLSGLRAILATHSRGWGGATDEDDDLAEGVDSQLWYHTIELPGGVVTPGNFDHRPLVPYYGIPENLQGKRALDIGTWDGFWAFEFERRGARVLAVDLDRLSEIDYPTGIREALRTSGLDQKFGGGFELAKSALGSKVERLARSIYDLDPQNIGTFELVHVGDVLQHLECPTRALRHVRSVTDGLAIISISFLPQLGDEMSLRYHGGWRNAYWWAPSLNAMGQMIVDAGFSDVTVHTAYRIRATTGISTWQAVIHARS